MGNNKGMHDKYLPFTEETVKKHLYGGKTKSKIKESQETQLKKIRGSISSFEKYKNKIKSLECKTLTELRSPCQIQKDERFWTMNTLLHIFYSPNRTNKLIQLFKKGYRQDILKSIGLKSWEECFENKNLELYFEVYLSSPAKYKDWLSEEYSKFRKNEKPNKHQIIPYILASACQENTKINADPNDKIVIKKNIEGPTRVDAMIINPDNDNDFSVIIEAKVSSDISVSTTYDLSRNQIARIIDVMLEANGDMGEPFNKRDPEKTIFLLITPEIFKGDKPNEQVSRFYGYKMREYMDQEKGVECLKKDLPHRTEEVLKNIPSRIGWLTWEDIKKEVNSQCPPWDIDYQKYF